MEKDHAKESGKTMTHEDAIGLIETQGLVGIIEAADVMCKAANVEIVGKVFAYVPESHAISDRGDSLIEVKVEC